MQNLPVARDALLEISSPQSLAFLIDPSRLDALRPGFEQVLAAHLGKAVTRIWAGDLASGVRMISGCGFGLTPSGDDFICGMLVGFRLLEQVCGRDLSKKIETVYHAAESDSFLSRNFLAMAYQGCVDARMKALLSALISGDEVVTRERTESVISVGETSGADLLTGLLMTLEKHT
jgi:hypothetical protein